jgi:hypothetical protein
MPNLACVYVCRKLPFSYIVRDRHTTNSCFTRRHLTENEVKGKNVFIDQTLSTDHQC